MRHAALLLLLCACSSLSSEQRNQLAMHQRNALHYYEGGRLDQALAQIDRGLELDAGDYKLNAIKGAILLKTSGSSLGQDHRQLDEATALLERVYEERSPNRHEQYLLLPYALALQKQGRRHLGESLSLTDQATRAVDKVPLQRRAEDARQAATERLQRARAVLAVLIERGELLRLCHYHLLLIAQDLRDAPTFDAAAGQYLEQLAVDRASTQRELDRTPVPGFEQELTRQLLAMRQEELDVRVLLAEHHYSQKNYEAALAMLDRVLEIDPARSVDYYNRGRVQLELQRTEAAKADFRKFLATTTLPDDSQKKTFALSALAQ